MTTSFFARLVQFCCRHALPVVLASIVLGVAAGIFVFQHFEMDSNAENLFSADVAWRQRQAEFDNAFPQRNGLTVIVIDGATPERAQEAAVALKQALDQRKDLFSVVRDIQGSDFFAHNGLLFLSLADVRNTTQHVIQAQPFLAPLAADPSLRGIMDSFSTALLGVENGETKLDDLARPFVALAGTLDDSLAGHPAFLSWQALVSGDEPSTRTKRRLIEVQAALDYNALAAGSAASDMVRGLARELGLTSENGVTVRLTGPVPIADEEFLTLTDRAALMGILMLSAILITLWFAVRSPKIIAAILLTLLVGLALTTAVGLGAIGKFNVISVAFIPLFVGIGIDFAIQYSVRYRAERHAHGSLEPGLMQAGRVMGPPLTLAAAATALCFYSFMPTSFSGVAELGFIAGNGMIIAYLLSGTMLPSLLKLLQPKAEREEIGYTALAPVDNFLRDRRRAILATAGALCLGGLALLPFLEFDANPLDLRSSRVESMATFLDLMKDPETSPNTIEILAPSLGEARDLAARLAQLPDVDHTTTLESFTPSGQSEKLALIADAAQLLDTTLDPFDVKPQPTKAQTLASIAATRDRLLKVAAAEATPAAMLAHQLAESLAKLEKADASALTRADAALVPGLKTVLMQLRAALAPQPIELETLPDELKSEWLAPDGKARVEVAVKGDANNNATLQRFASEVRVIAPNATGAPISTYESGRTIVEAFTQAGLLSLLAIVALLFIALRNTRDVILTLGPLLAASVMTFATCVALGLKLNFANIIVLPLLFGIGVAFHIYFVIAWREGGRNFLQSSLSRAVLFSALTTATGFGTLWLSSHPGTASMGELLMISLAWTLITLFFLPALLETAKAR